MPRKTLLLALLTGLLGGLLGTWLLSSQSSSNTSPKKETAFERVLRTKTLRCAYFTWQPYFMKDPTTGEYSGLNYEEIAQAAKILGLKLEITEEVPFSEFATNLANGRNDTICGTLWPSGSRAKVFDFTVATDYLGAYAVVREGDTRFDGNLDKLNSPDYTLAAMEGDYSQDIVNEDFPKAKQYSNPQDTDGTQLLMALLTKKADAVFLDAFLIHEFEKKNPGKIRKVGGVEPVRIFGDSFVVAKGETGLRDMLNAAINQMNQSGFLRQTLDKYLGEYKGEYYYPAQPYEKSK
jgi:ABC-type amino acid transport substrate-binding protein